MPLADNSAYSSPNWSPRSGRPLRMLVIHATAGSARGSLKWLSTPLSQASVHYLIDKSGRVYQLVPEERMAWHAGGCRWQGISDVDDVSIGVELENNNTGIDSYPDEQMASLLEVAAALVANYDIKPENVVRHCDIAQPPGREIDPAGFPWERFIAQLFPNQRPAASHSFPLPLIPPPSAAEACRESAYRQIGLAYRPGWAAFRIALQMNLGSPLLDSFQLTVASRTYMIQPFARDVLVAPLGEWESARRLGQLAADRQLNELRLAVLEELYARAGGSLKPDGAFQQYAEREPTGPPLQAAFHLQGRRFEYEAEIYALDTLYSPVGPWKEIKRLGMLTRGMFDRRPPQLDEEERALREELLVQLFRRAGAGYHPEWPLHQRAIQWSLGAPLAQPVRCTYGGRDFIAQPYALDVLYSQIGDWSHVQRVDGA